MGNYSLFKTAKEWQETIQFAMPSMVLLLVILLAPLPWPLGDFYPIAPKIPFIIIFYTRLLHPALLPSALLFMFGLIADLLNGTPFGLYAGLFVLCSFITHQTRHLVVDAGFFAWWGLLLPILCGTIVMEYMVLYIMTGVFFTLDSGFSIITSWICFPLIAILLSKLTPNVT
ncbi:MAG: rod shape-determining protein MreD [Alphaproteobacteria bacterium]